MVKIEDIGREVIKKLPKFFPGDEIELSIKIKEGDKERLQQFSGIVIRKRGSGISKTFTVRKISYGVGVERTFLLYSPSLAKIKILKRGKVRRAKLYYLREKKGKGATLVKTYK
ncbi:TPA: 50S ribosomal protein L19 [bacterium]|nr:50S ribosomal protein L19 [bacterium]